MTIKVNPKNLTKQKYLLGLKEKKILHDTNRLKEFVFTKAALQRILEAIQREEERSNCTQAATEST